jgi:phosphoserine phosphatase RsbU/P
MCPFFHSRSPESPQQAEPVATVFPKIDGADIGAVLVGQRVAGDFYDSVRVSPERVLFGLLDVSGRREENRSLLATAQDVFRNFGGELFSRADLNESDAMTELCLRINRSLIEVSPGVHPCPAFVACYHEKFGTLCYTNAGHTPGLLRDSSGIAELAPTGLPLGLFSHATCDAPTIGMEKGAVLLLVSRGVVACSQKECGGDEEKSPEQFSLDRVKALLQADSSGTAQALCASVVDAAGKFSSGMPVRDDRTALALLRTA